MDFTGTATNQIMANYADVCILYYILFKVPILLYSMVKLTEISSFYLDCRES